jgi:hypothetical protein
MTEVLFERFVFYIKRSCQLAVISWQLKAEEQKKEDTLPGYSGF